MTLTLKTLIMMMKNLRHNTILRALTVLCLMMASVGAWAEDYVFMNGNYFLGQTTAATTNFVPNASIYTGTSGSTFRNANNYYIRYNNGLQFSTTNSTNLTINNNNELYYYANRTYNYLNLNGTTWRMTNATNRATAYVVKTTTIPAGLEEFSITTGNDRIEGLSSNNKYTHSNTSYISGYTKYEFSTRTYYSTNPANAAFQTEPAKQTNGITYTWSLEGADGYASVNSTSGDVNYSDIIPERERTVTLKCTATHTSGATFIATKTITLVNPNALFDPAISYDNAAGGRVSVTLSYPESDPEVKLYYTTNGSNPSASSTLYTAPFEVASNTTVKVIAVKGSTTSGVVTTVVENITPGVSGGKVVLDDREDHTWTYYAGVPEEVDGGYYKGNTSGYKGKIYSPNPRNVKITYNGVNGITGSTITVKVSNRTGEDQTSFVYYKTLEEGATAGQYPYQVISNPFSVRPSTGTGNGKVFYGFNGWKIVSGGEYINGYSNGETLPLDAEITFVNLPYPSVNCTSAQIVFETTWTQARVQRGGANVSANAFNGGNYETNFCVINANYANALAPTYPVTITNVEPDGSQTYNVTFSNLVTPANGAANMTKMEYINWNPSGAIGFQGRNMTIGRGVVCGGTTRAVTLSNSTGNVNQVAKIESGTYTTLTNYSAAPSGITKQRVVLGNDYDRAKRDWEGNNPTLNFTGRMETANQLSLVTNSVAGANTMVTDITAKSGKFMSGIAIAQAARANTWYLGTYTSGNTGKRSLEIEGGEFASIGGGRDSDLNGTKNTKDYVNVYVRMHDGHVRGCIWGGAEQYSSQGGRQIVITGGEINGWVCGGANGTSTNNGATNGMSYVYVGGNTRVDSKGNATTIGASLGGNVYGAGCGYSPSSDSGQMQLGTNLVIADHAYIERGAYGGGAFGFVPAGQNSYLYVTGEAHVEGKSGNYSARNGDVTNGVIGGVFGGARQRSGGYVNLFMTGGQIDTGVFGGSNYTGTINNDVKMVVTGGQVGKNGAPGNIHGGGYGEGTVVSGNVEMTLGNLADVKGVKVYGNVYGGSALGTTGGNTKHTYVTVNRGSITGNVFGGGMGEAGSNTKGVVTGAIKVDVYGTDPKPTDGTYALHGVYGGGDLAPYSGTPLVTVHNCDNSIEYVYGGGNATSVGATDVTIYGGDKIGNVFGGGNGQVRAANIGGNTSVKIYGGTIGDVYGGSNTNGNIGGTISVLVNAQAEGGHDACPVDIDNVYGGGNQAASAAGQITIGCAEHIGAVYGGANQANVTGNISLNIKAGNIGNVFGGNNNSGEINGTITVNINEDRTAYPCGMSVGNVYGGGNKAAYTGNPTVNIINATTTGSVFGGGLGKTAIVTGNPQVNIGSWTEGSVVIGGDVFGGGDLAAVEGNPTVVIKDCETIIKGDLYGGGNAAPVHSTNTTMWGGSVWGNAFGGGNGADPTKNANGAQVGYKSDDTTKAGSGDATMNIYGGTIGVWNGDECTAGGGIFGGSNTNGNIAGQVNLTVDQRKDGSYGCLLKLKELYGAGNKAAYNGTGINFNLGCVDYLEEIYGGAKAADLNADAVLTIRSGHFKKVFGGNNVSGKLNGKIEVNVDETGCNPIIIEELYGGGNLAAYSVFGYEDALVDGKVVVKTSGDAQPDPQINIISCTHIGQIFGGGLGTSATMVGNPIVSIQEVMGNYPRKHYNVETKAVEDGAADQLGTIGIIFGGGNEAKVIGSTYINIATEDGKGANITGNVYGGGNAADVTGKTNVTIAPQPQP